MNNTTNHARAFSVSKIEEAEGECTNPRGSESEAGCNRVHSDDDEFESIWDADDIDTFYCSIQDDEDVDLGMD